MLSLQDLLVLLPAFSGAIYMPSIVLERPVYRRERDDRLYTAISYVCEKIAEELFVAAIGSLLTFLMW